MASNPLFIIPVFFLHFPNKLCYGYLTLEGNGKIPMVRSGKNLPSWLSQFSKTKLRQPKGQKRNSKRNFPISFKPKIAIAEFFWKMQRKTWYSILGVDAMPLSLKNLLLSFLLCNEN